MPPDARVGVIGGGFTGSMLAVHLARAARSPLTIEIIEPRVTLGSGLAYGSCGPEHLINVPSDRMSVFAEDPSHFARWIADRGSDNQACRPSDGNAYPRRSDFGAYVRQLVAAAGGSGSQIRHVRAAGHVLAREAAGWSVGLDNGEVVSYDHVVLCVTHGPPAFPMGSVGKRAATAASDPRSMGCRSGPGHTAWGIRPHYRLRANHVRCRRDAARLGSRGAGSRRIAPWPDAATAR